eukprot:TRINITY_DN26040_c0_g1_i1.p1 TRINITY_DN26040_c0_g1~~TRINITY_DN26040_c0_g1_i1.p1  ORF type:complete len:221 (-),score=46.86 TRINITY_DN26040_c0_g1_i1:1062-1724(-)
MGCGTSKRHLPREDEDDVSGQFEFKVILWKCGPDDTLGLSLTDKDDKSLGVDGIRPDGLVAHFFQVNPEMSDKRILEGYTIVGVNDVSLDCAAMRKELDDKILVELTVRRTTACHVGSIDKISDEAILFPLPSTEDGAAKKMEDLIVKDSMEAMAVAMQSWQLKEMAHAQAELEEPEKANMASHVVLSTPLLPGFLEPVALGRPPEGQPPLADAPIYVIG